MSVVGLLSRTRDRERGTSAARGGDLPNCTAADNLEAIIDDSGSMAVTDDQRFRVDMVNILADAQPGEDDGRESSSAATPTSLFLAKPIGPNLGAIASALNAVQADNGGTDYEQGFTVANCSEPGANARIFLSDGEPNFAPDPNVWKSPNIKTYVVGFGSVDPTVLSQIATDTGGPAPFNVTSTAQLRTVAGDHQRADQLRAGSDPDHQDPQAGGVRLRALSFSR